MPTFTALALDRLIEPGVSKTMAPGKNGSESKLERRNSTNSKPERGTSFPLPRPERSSSMTSKKKNHPAWISPALYATPESTPLPDSPSSFPPSPYIINHKRRGPRLLKSSSHNDIDRRDMDEEKGGENAKNGERKVVDSDKGSGGLEETAVNGVIHDGEFGSGERSNESSAGGGQNRSMKAVMFEAERDSEAEDFYDFQDSMSVKSSSEGENMAALERSLTAVTPMAEFYDAWEELSSESGPQLLHDIETELREMQLSLLTEMEKRKQAEAALNSMRNQWTRISQQLSAVGLSLPPDPTAVADHEQQQVVVDPADELCRQIAVARFVSNAIGRGIAKAEIEEEMEAQIESMNFEISRLMDRLHYYEAVNREMSQRNQEVVETARRLRQSRKRRQRWVWGSIATAITLGTAALAWSYLPSGKSSPSVCQSRAPDTDHSSSK